MKRSYLKKKPFKRKPKTERQQVIKANDDLLRKIIRLRDKYTCQKTGKKTNLQVSHFWSRSNLRVRWDLDNVCLLNAGTHLYWAHKNPQAFQEFWIKRLGQKKYEALRLKALFVAPVKIFDLYYTHKILKDLLKKFEELNGREE